MTRAVPAGCRILEVWMYTSIIPATDWCFVHNGESEKLPPVVWRLAAWGVNSDGNVIGLIGAFGEQQGASGKTPSLSSVPTVAGRYLHREQLNEMENEQLGKRAAKQQ